MFDFQTEHRVKDLRHFNKECKIHLDLRHPNIIRMLSSFETPEQIVVITECADKDLHKYMNERKMKSKENRTLSEPHMQQLTWDLFSALHYLHSKRIMHRDLKPQNVLLDAEGLNAKLCDFGLARNMTEDTLLLSSVKGTPLYMAPEVIDNEPYDQQADFWSMGCILYETLAGQPPFRGEKLQQLLFMLRNRNSEIVWPNASGTCLSFLKGLLQRDSKERFAWEQILNHDFVKGRLVLVADETSACPLTVALTESQSLAKEQQRHEIKQKKDKKILAVKEKMCKLLAQPKGGAEHNAAAMRMQQSLTTDNESLSSQDSVNAIVQTDIETDVEGARPAPPESSKTNFVIKRFAENFSISPHANSLMNSNLVIGNMADNFSNDLVAGAADNRNADTDEQQVSAAGRCKDLEKKKLANNLDNFTIRMANNASSNDGGENSPKGR